MKKRLHIEVSSYAGVALGFYFSGYSFVAVLPFITFEFTRSWTQK